ncbi:MAG: tRNA threonylcarbamoyladenosine dehydratase [Burkholderiaceae bacterium]|nr:tRNA threonylcarbamoyladenosine dehydratase [Burkholderiaceae bacterium]
MHDDALALAVREPLFASSQSEARQLEARQLEARQLEEPQLEAPRIETIDASAALRVDDDRRRFGGVARLYGDAALDALAAAQVCVVGVGGVGSWAAEALARSGVGCLTLIDADHVAASNVNRQVHALDSTLGAAKIDVMRLRIADIAPRCQVRVVDDFVTPENVADLVPAGAFVVDAIDAPRAKAALVASAVRRRQPIVVCGAAGGRTDPLRLRRDDLARTTGDALLASVRARLRRDYGFERRPGAKFGVTAIHSDEPPPAKRCTAPGAGAGFALSCAGYGSLVTVTAAMGLAAASFAIARLVAGSSAA